jgi:hypothetical protein
MVDLVAAYMLAGTIALLPSLYLGGNPTELTWAADSCFG